MELEGYKDFGSVYLMERLINMNINRQYRAANCLLTLEGMNDGNSDPTVMSILLNAELRLANSPQVWSGGKSFLDNLTKAVNAYVQEFLSGLRHPQKLDTESEQINIESRDNLHHLTWSKTDTSPAEVRELDLTTIQLFDLVETIDQFLLDTSTLPDFKLPLQPVSRRYRKPEKTLGERILPPIVGVGSVALAAIGFSFLEPPVVREPQPQPLENPSEVLPEVDPE